MTVKLYYVSGILDRKVRVAMDVKEAVLKAADYVADIESMTRPDLQGLEPLELLGSMDFAVEGVSFDENGQQWLIDVGFVRRWDRSRPTALTGLAGSPVSNMDKRTFKEIIISDENGKVIKYGSSSSH